MSSEMIAQIRRDSFFIAALSLLLIAGCKGAKEESKESSAKSAAEEAVAPTPNKDLVPVIESSMLRMIEGLKQNRPEVVWQAMPVGFQRDVNGLVREFAAKMDPEFWDEAFAVWKGLARLLKEKKRDLLAHAELADLSAEQRQRLEKNWDGIVELLTILVHSDVSDLEKLRSFEMGAFLEQTGGPWLEAVASLSESLGQESLSGMLQGLEPITLNYDENTAVMAWTAPGDDKPISRFTMVKLEDRWIPAGWEAAWQRVSEWKGKLRQTPKESLAEQSREKLKFLKQAEEVIETLLETQTREEFYAVLNRELDQGTIEELAGVAFLLSGPSEQANSEGSNTPPTVPNANAGGKTVTLLIKGAKGTGDEDRIFEAIQSAVPGDVDVQFFKTPDGLKVTCGPVADVEAFAKKLKFGTIEKHDTDSMTIHIKMNP